MNHSETLLEFYSVLPDSPHSVNAWLAQPDALVIVQSHDQNVPVCRALEVCPYRYKISLPHPTRSAGTAIILETPPSLPEGRSCRVTSHPVTYILCSQASPRAVCWNAAAPAARPHCSAAVPLLFAAPALFGIPAIPTDMGFCRYLGTLTEALSC